MSEDIPLWLSITIVAFLLWGSGLTLVGTIGLVRFKSFYERLHMPTLGTSWGVGGIIISSIIYFSVMEDRLMLHELLLTVFLVVTTPVTLMMLSRASMHRDQSEDWRRLPRELLPHRPEDTLEILENVSDDTHDAIKSDEQQKQH